MKWMISYPDRSLGFQAYCVFNVYIHTNIMQRHRYVTCYKLQSYPYLGPPNLPKTVKVQKLWSKIRFAKVFEGSKPKLYISNHIISMYI
jgi:hypothetical protein